MPKYATRPKDVLKKQLEMMVGGKLGKKQEQALRELLSGILSHEDTDQLELTLGKYKSVNPQQFNVLERIASIRGSINIPTTKTNVSRSVPLSKELLEVLRRYFPQVADPTNDYIVKPECKILSDTDRDYRFNTRALVNPVLKSASLINVNCHGKLQKVTPHTFRYTFCSLLLNKGIAPDIVRRLAGHSKQEMTDHYAYLMTDEMDISFETED